MTPDKNKEVALAMGIAYPVDDPTQQFYVGGTCIDKLLIPKPKFDDDAGAVQLLRLMMKRLSRDDFFTFIRTVGFGSSSDDYWYIYGTYITTKGKLLEAVWLWRREHPK
jgi:hypothetical protein